MLYLLDESSFAVNWGALAECFRQRAGAPAATGHPDVAPALRFIAHNLIEPLDVDFVVAALPVGRRTLERRFETFLGTSVSRAITLVRLEIARQLLCRSCLTITEISVEVGFSSTSRMANVFRRELHLSPRQIRHAHSSDAVSGVDSLSAANRCAARWLDELGTPLFVQAERPDLSIDPVVEFSSATWQTPLDAPDEVSRKLVAPGEVIDARSEATTSPLS